MRIKTVILSALFALVSSAAMATTVIPAGDDVKYSFSGSGLSFTYTTDSWLTSGLIHPDTCTGCILGEALALDIGNISDTITVGVKSFIFGPNAFTTIGTSSTTFNLAPLSYAGTLAVSFIPEVTGAVPEPATWAMFLLGFGAIGWTLRSNRQKNALTA